MELASLIISLLNTKFENFVHNSTNSCYYNFIYFNFHKTKIIKIKNVYEILYSNSDIKNQHAILSSTRKYQKILKLSLKFCSYKAYKTIDGEVTVS